MIILRIDKLLYSINVYTVNCQGARIFLFSIKAAIMFWGGLGISVAEMADRGIYFSSAILNRIIDT